MVRFGVRPLHVPRERRAPATRGGVLGVYQRAQRWPEQKAAMTVWGTKLQAVITGAPPAENVVTLHPPAA